MRFFWVVLIGSSLAMICQAAPLKALPLCLKLPKTQYLHLRTGFVPPIDDAHFGHDLSHFSVIKTYSYMLLHRNFTSQVLSQNFHQPNWMNEGWKLHDIFDVKKFKEARGYYFPKEDIYELYVQHLLECRKKTQGTNFHSDLFLYIPINETAKDIFFNRVENPESLYPQTEVLLTEKRP